ncbi:HicB-like antitoxin [Gordonia phage Phabuloso]|nr:HicB-like antitoxin [Gordonia phage Phabuloso]
MSEPEPFSFIDACLEGDAAPTEIDDWIDRWHAGEVLDLSLDEFLGFTPEEGKAWAEDPTRLDDIINAHRGLHLVYTNYGPEYAWALSSPQIPNLTAGRATAYELQIDTDGILEFAGSTRRVGDPDVYFHEQLALVDPSGIEYLVRFQADDSEDRLHTASRLVGSVSEGWTPEEVEMQPQLVTTERLLIAVTPSDPIGWIEDQLGEGGCAALSWHKGEDILLTIPFANGTLGRRSLRTLGELGLKRSSTFGELAEAVVDAECHDLISSHSIKADHVAIVHGLTRV